MQVFILDTKLQHNLTDFCPKVLWDKEVWEKIYLYISGRTLFY